MKLFELTRAMIFVIPLGIFTTLTALLYIINAMKVRRLEANHNKIFFFYLPCATLTSAFFISYFYYPGFFERVAVVYCGSLVFTIVLFHHIHCFTMGLEKRFNPLHYIVPAIVLISLLATKLFLPGFLSNRNYDLLFYIILIFSAYYTILGLYEMHRFYIRMAIAYGSTDAINHSMAIFLVIEKLMFPAVFGLLPFIGGQNPGIIVSILLMVSILSALFNNIPFVYSIIRFFTLNDLNRFLFDALQLRRPTAGLKITGKGRQRGKWLETLTEHKDCFVPANDGEKEPHAKRIYRKYTQKDRIAGLLIEVNKADFESYFRENKPYLNPHLTIDDLTKPLQSNRTYLSKFINRTYGMNFHNYLNTCRLREMERLLATPGNRDKTAASLYAQAGFGNYRNYLNAKNSLNKPGES